MAAIIPRRALLGWSRLSVPERAFCLGKVAAQSTPRGCTLRPPPRKRLHTTTGRLQDVAQTMNSSPAPSTIDALPLPSADTSGASTPEVKLRPYQERAVEECLSAIASGTTRIGVSSPTGSGKTTMFTELITRLPSLPKQGSLALHLPSSSSSHSNEGSRVLIIVNTIELATQTAMSVSRAHPHLVVEIEQGTKFKASGFADVTVATYQTLARGESRLGKFSPDGLKAIIVDEAHHAAAASYISLLSYFDEEVGFKREEREARKEQEEASSSNIAKQRKIPIIGFSATFSRHDGLSLGRIFERIVYHRDFLEMIDEEWLSPVRFTTVKSDVDLRGVKTSRQSGDYNPTALADVINTGPINRLIVGAWLERASDRRSTLGFCATVKHAIDLTEEFRRAGIDTRYVHGGTPIKERRLLLEQFKAGEFRILLNCAILTEGFDLPTIDTVLLARPTRSRNLFSQMIGRGLRLSPQTGKQDCLVLDLVGTIDRGVICTPTLFGLDPGEAVEGKSVEDLKEAIVASGELSEGDQTALDLLNTTHNAQEEDDSDRKVTFIDYDSPHELQEAVSKRSSFLPTLSPFAWIHCGGDVYVLEIPKQGHLRIWSSKEVDFGDADAEAAGGGGEFQTDQETRPGGVTHWYATYTPPSFMGGGFSQRGRSGRSPYLRPRNILSPEYPAPSLEDCIRVCDTYATKHVLGVGPPPKLLRRDAEWRKDAASNSQKLLVAKRLGISWDGSTKMMASAKSSSSSPSSSSSSKRDHAATDTDTWAKNVGGEPQGRDIMAGLTKGKAMEILARLKFGFKGRWQETVKQHNRAVRGKVREDKAREKELEKETSRLERERMREEKYKAKETVKVGDL